MQIGPQAYPYEEYEISDSDEAGTTKYFGFVNRYGQWKIMKNDTTAGTYRYLLGNTAYTTNWAARAGLTYYYYYEL